MKIENTLENKSKFFAQYWYQDVFVFVPNMQTYKITKSRFNAETLKNPCYLQLKPLESISDEDAIEVIGLVEFKLKQNDKSSGYFGMSASGIFVDTLNVHGESYLIDKYNIDYLRSKSYALPWMGLSVQDLIDYGWIKIK